MTVRDIINESRTLVNDTKNNAYIWQDAEYMRWINAGQEYIYYAAPECRLLSDNSLNVFATASSIDSSLYLPNDYKRALVEYVVSQYFAADVGNNRNMALSQMHFDKFMSFLYGTVNRTR